MNLKARLQKLERQHSGVPRVPHRLIISYVGGPLDPPSPRATCQKPHAVGEFGLMANLWNLWTWEAAATE